MNLELSNPIVKNRLNLYLKPVYVTQIILLEALHYPAYTYINNEFKEVLKANEGITTKFISDYAQTYSKEIFIFSEDFELLNKKLKDEVTKLTRSLSIGDPAKNAKKQISLLTMQMQNLYNDPFDDELLSNHFQSSRNLSNLLLNNKELHRALYKDLTKQSYHYTQTQPMLSSILLLSFIQSLQLFSQKEIEGLFLTSYFKDIGMSFIPREKFELAHLSEFDKELFSQHAENSMKILDSRVPLSKHQLNMIKNHHYLNYKIQALINKSEVQNDEQFLSGIESALLSGIDILVAMTNPRPYRDPVSTFKALELLKRVLSDDYPQEFKALVFYIKTFFKV